MKKLLVLAALLVLLVACGDAKKQVAIDTNPFLGGSQGLAISFQDLRSEVFDGGSDPFDVIVKLENKGESLVKAENVKVKLSGINPSDFAKSENDLNLNAPDDVVEMRKDPSGSVLPGPQTFVDFTGLNYKKALAGAQAQFSLRADVCYLYRTKAVSKLCVRDNLLTPAPGGICEINADKTVFNSGAPVQVSNVRESTRSKDKVGLSFEITNVGGGNVFERNSMCNRDDRQKENHVYVVVSTGMSGLSCTGLENTATGAEGFVTLYSGSKIVSCTQEVSSRSDFEQLTNIEVIYDYEERTQSSFVVKSSGAQE